MPVHEKHELHQRIFKTKRVDISAGEPVKLKMIVSSGYKFIEGIYGQANIYHCARINRVTKYYQMEGVTLAVTSKEVEYLLQVKMVLYRNDEILGVMQFKGIFA